MTSPDFPPDVPTPIDFHDLVQARAWTEETERLRPWRPRFFAAFAAALNAEGRTGLSVIELGSGPGRLAAELLAKCPVADYAAVDFSPAMHLIAREHLEAHLGQLARRARFIERDFREAGWAEGLGPADAIVTHQAAHEVRHVARLPALFSTVHGTLRDGGVFLICDHYWEADVAWKQVPLYLTPESQLALMAEAGFGELAVLHDEGGMRLIAGRKR